MKITDSIFYTIIKSIIKIKRIKIKKVLRKENVLIINSGKNENDTC
jgi:hypothetical protein